MSTHQLEVLVDPVALEGFSSPHELFDNTFFENLVQETASAVLQLFVDRFRDELKMSSVDLVPTVLEITNRLTFEDIWTPVIGQCLHAIRKDSTNEAKQAALGLLLHMAARGLAGSWRIDLKEPGVFLWDSYALAPSDTFFLESDGRAVASVELRNDSVRFVRNESGYWESDGAVAFPSIQTLHGRAVLLSRFREFVPECFRLELPLVLEISQEQLTAISDGFEVLERSAPRYHQWVCRILRYLGVIESPEQFMRSGSSEWFWGIVAISDNRNPLSICEMLIHECSHQYFNLITRLGSASENSLLYYSPFPKAMRPLSKIMLGYHAFGNVFLFYRECLSDPTVATECELRMRTVRDDLRSVEGLAVNPQNWTSIGHSLIQPLAERIKNEK